MIFQLKIGCEFFSHQENKKMMINEKTIMSMDYSIKNEKILIFEPHPDDVAYNLMGSVVKWLSEEKDIYICTITKGNNSTFKKEVNMDEIEEIMKNEHEEVHEILGLGENKTIQWDYDDLGLDPGTDRKELVERMIGIIREIKPTTVVTMDPKNIQNEENPDHRIVAMTGFEAAAMSAYPNVFRQQIEEDPKKDQHFVSRVLFYMTPEPNVFVDISGEPLRKKKEIGTIYKSQLDLMISEIDARLRNMGLDPEIMNMGKEEIWGTICESMAEETAGFANEFYDQHPDLAPKIRMTHAESFRLYFLGAVEKLRDYLPKDLLTL